MSPKSLVIAAVLSLTVAFTASAQSQQATEKRFHVDGKIVSVRPASRTAVIDAKAIPGFMSAMAMPYAFKDSAELAKVKVGDHITTDLVVSGGKSWVEKVVVQKDSAAGK